MYIKKFLEYNNLTNEVMSEADTLDNALTNLDKATKEDKVHLTDVETWARYAFENGKEYFITIYENEKPIVCINNYFRGITVDFLTYNKEEWFRYLSMDYEKAKQSPEGDYIKYPDNKMFLRQVTLFQEDELKKITNEMLFKDEGVMNVESIIEKKIPEFQVSYEEKETNVNLSHNWIELPRTYDDYEHLLDYKNILKPEYLNLRLN